MQTELLLQLNKLTISRLKHPGFHEAPGESQVA
jgi:hypothetical protein